MKQGEYMDISVLLTDIKLNIRSAVIIETEYGYIFDQDKLEGYYYVVGGRIKINESSEDAAKREIYEEIGIKIGEIKLKAIVESFFECDNKKYHEICFYYNYKINRRIHLSENYFIFDKEEIKTKDIQPKIIYDIIDSEDDGIIHWVLNG
jgi:8-oxo-dGTP pyrophosphatase MutT (NUDIX family)